MSWLLGPLLLVSAPAWAQPAGAPLPETLSEQARAAVAANAASPQPSLTNLADRRNFLEQGQVRRGVVQQRKYAADVEDSTLAGVPVRLITPKARGPKSRQVFLNLHGGGFDSDSGSRTENIPIAALTGVPVVAVLYRLAPEHPFPAAVDDGLAVYRELLKTHRARDIGIYGTSAGAILGPQLVRRIRAEGLPAPAVLGMFSGDADLSRRGDSALGRPSSYRAYLGAHATMELAVSPGLGDLRAFPPTLCITSTRDFLLSGTVNFCRGLEQAGVENRLVVFDGLPHAFWAYLDTPESDQAFAIMARFLAAHLAPGR